MRRGRDECPVSGASLRLGRAGFRRTAHGAPSTSKISTALTLTPHTFVEAKLPATLLFWSCSAAAHGCLVTFVTETFVCPSQLMLDLVPVSICQEGLFNYNIYDGYVAVVSSLSTWGVPVGLGALLEGGSQTKPRLEKSMSCVCNLLCFRPRLSGLVKGLEFSGVWKILVLASCLSLDQSVTFMPCVEFLKHVLTRASIMAYPKSQQLYSPIAVAFFGSRSSAQGLGQSTNTNRFREASQYFVQTAAVVGCHALRSPGLTRTACVELGRLPLPERPLQLPGGAEQASQTQKLLISCIKLCQAHLEKQSKTLFTRYIAQGRASGSHLSTTPLPKQISTICPMQVPQGPQICQEHKPTSETTKLSSEGAASADAIASREVQEAFEESPWTLDIAQPQILINYGYDDRESYHHCVLLYRVRGSVWTVLTPDMERYNVDLADPCLEYHNLQRLGKFPTFAFTGGLFYFDPFEPGELTHQLRAAKDEATLLFGDMPPAGARQWRFTDDPAHSGFSADNFGTVVDPKFLYDAPAFVMLEGHGFVMIDESDHRVALVDDPVSANAR